MFICYMHIRCIRSYVFFLETFITIQEYKAKKDSKQTNNVTLYLTVFFP